MTVDTIEREVSINAPIERVWALITEAEHLGTWFGTHGAAIDLRPGGDIEMRWDGHDITGVVATVAPTSLFAFRWRQVAGVPSADLGIGNSTLVEFSLAVEGDTTIVRLVESGFASLELSAEDRDGMYAGHSEGWTRELEELVAYAPGVAA